MQVRYFLMSFLVLATLLVGCAATRHQESTGEFIDDSVISTKVKTALLRCPMVSGLDVHVRTFKHRVQLNGFVDDMNQVEQAIALAEEIGGVTAVENRMSIK
ncbi:BON domain-containing protein [Nitrospira sp. M1]